MDTLILPEILNPPHNLRDYIITQERVVRILCRAMMVAGMKSQHQ